MKVGVVIFPGSNCDQDAIYAFQNQFAHDIILKGETPHFKILDIKPRWIFQIASGNGNSTW